MPSSVIEERRLDRRVALSVAFSVLAAAAALLPLLGRKLLGDWDEAIYGEISRELLGHRTLALSWQLQPWFEKPPLYMWLTAACFRLFSVNEFWARAVSAFSGMALVGLIHGVLARVRGLAPAWISTVILLSTMGFFRACHLGEVDTLLTLGCFVSLLGIGRIRSGLQGESKRNGWILFWLGLAVAVMTKGAAAVVVPLTLVVLLVWERWPRRVFGGRFLMGLVIFLALVLPWHVVMYREFGAAFLHEYLGEQMLARATSQLERHHNPPWFFVEVLWAFAAPWILIFPVAAWRGLRPDRVCRPLREYSVFALVVFAVFTVSQTRLPRYVVPMYPAIALVVADGVAGWLSLESLSVKKTTRWWSAAAASAAAFALCALLTRGVRERVTSPSTSFGPLHVDRNYLPLLRAEKASGIAGPLLLGDDGGWMPVPAAVFYTGRRVQQVFVAQRPETNGRARRYFNPQPLTDFVATEPRLLVIPKELVAQLPAGMEFRELREAGDLEIGTISLR